MAYSNNTNYQQFIYQRDPLREALELYGTPTVIAFGVFGNIWAILTFYYTSIKRIPATHSMMALAVVDNGVLITILLMTWLPRQRIDIYNKYGWCQIIILCNFVSIFLSPWYLVCLLIERYLDLVHPSSQWRIKTTFRARLISIGLAILALAFYLHIAWIFGVDEQRNLCGLWPGSANYYHKLNIIDTIIVVLLPTICFVVLLFRLLLYMWYDCQTRRSLRCLQPNLRQNANTTTIVTNYKPNTVINNPTNERICPTDMGFDLTTMVTTITFATIVLTLLNNASRVAMTFGNRRFTKIISYFSIVNNLNYACRFYIYFIVSPTFRYHLRELLLKTCKCIIVDFCRPRTTEQDIPAQNISNNEMQTIPNDTQN
ncbi:somatostatin receptor type 2-like [Octopus vulgaris]|uniref:Somatostatin receptor type 2-like n=2 Tax=Octopus TaxID=6643 RepID=A0AA36EWX1_OCTVU|nr:somatostatin receptor type 2-like [Octopus sinensis]XP_036356332.1 somatostatin receptor type 2-like [Octopus sinensis]XP_036356333.1 somatostatin receptor type 2-like [Octopus sinensis]CAI9717276.1 somatostatin receptor type 2-like [Octopus vulgaris]